MRYGSIRYVNNLPVDHGLVSGQTPGPAGLAVVEGTPAELNRAVSAGELDVAAVSAGHLLAPHSGLRVLPEATIASHGRVDSVLLASKRPLSQLEGARIAVSDESATGALLLRVLLEHDAGLTPTYHTRSGPLGTMLQDHDAALVIGDTALAASAGLGGAPLEKLHVLDLGEAWRAYSGLPMVYALWVSQADTADTALEPFRAALSASRRWGQDNRDAIVTEAAARTGVPEPVLNRYYDRLSHTLGGPETAGLRRFADEVAQLDGHSTEGFALETLEVLA